MSRPILLAQVTDTHLLAQTKDQIRGCNPWQSLNAVLKQVVQCNPDGLLLTGDLADQGEAAAYRHLANAIAPLNLPIYWLPGNHDDLATLQNIFQSLPSAQGLTSINLDSWQLILLNSVLPQAKFGEGHLSIQQLQQLRAALMRYADNPTLVALHHHPVPVGIDWVDQMQVQNSHEFLTLLSKFSNVSLIVFGHVHYEFQRHSAHGPNFYSCPSTGLQVTSPNSTPEQHQSGFRLFWLYPDGTYKTEVRRVAVIPSPLPPEMILDMD